MERKIDTIISGLISRVDSSSKHKAYARATIEKHPRLGKGNKITFKKEEMEYLNPNRNNALVVSIKIINAQVKKVMIDIGSSTDIL